MKPGDKIIIHKPDGNYVWATVIRIEKTTSGEKVVAQSNDLLLRVSPKDCEIVP